MQRPGVGQLQQLPVWVQEVHQTRSGAAAAAGLAAEL
jgi:hypothetical protein